MKKFKKLLLSLALVATGVLALSVTAPKAHALSGSDFNPGRIIDDSVFFNKDAMSVGEIQNFLYAKSGPCDTNRPTTNSNYQPPWTCLYQYRENTTTKANNIGSPGSNPAGSITGAQIIYDAAQTYNISPKALIVLIQKESSLITDNWPWSNQYRTATGYGCPDTGPNNTAECDTSYYGFYNQVRAAARQFRLYANNPNGYNYKAGRNNNIGYNPNAACGTQTVYIQNQATAGLYNYTPYVPNAAALNNLYGTGDGCSAYGNRNFWRLYNDWFGSTQGVAYAASFAGQSEYPSIGAGGTSSAYIQYRNTGANAWYDDTSQSSGPGGTLPVHLATANPTNRISAFAATWPSGNRPAYNFSAVYESNGTTLASNQHVVQPGQIAKFSFTFTVPVNKGSGSYREYFLPVVEGTADGAFSYPDVWLDITVQQVYTTTSTSKGSNVTVRPTESATSYISYKNTGNSPWYDDISWLGAPVGSFPTHLATANATNRSSAFFNSEWDSPSRPALKFAAVYESDGVTLASDQHTVGPNQIGKFNITFVPPAGKAAGTYREYFRPVIEGSTDGALNDPSTYLDVIVTNGIAGSSTKATSDIALTPGASTTITTQFTNVGNTTWSRGSVYLKPDGANSTAQFRASAWSAADNAAALTESTVAPGSTGTFTAQITAPAQAGKYIISFAPGNSLDSFGKPNAKYVVTVAEPQYKAAFAGQSDYPAIAPGGTAAGYVQYRNTGNVAWYDDTSQSSGPSGTLPVHLATGSPTNRASAFAATWPSSNRPALNFSAVYESNGTTLAGNQHVVQPGQIAKFAFTFSVAANKNGGTYSEHFLPVVEGTPNGAFSYPDVWLDVVVQ